MRRWLFYVMCVCIYIYIRMYVWQRVKELQEVCVCVCVCAYGKDFSRVSDDDEVAFLCYVCMYVCLARMFEEFQMKRMWLACVMYVRLYL